MKLPPESDSTLVLRTYFDDQAAWEAICKTIQEPVGEFEFLADVEFVDDPDFDGVEKEQLGGLIPEERYLSFIIVADRESTLPPDFPLLIVDLVGEPGREFRAIPKAIQEVENNLSIANMDFEDFVRAVDQGGIFRGFT